MARSLSLLRRRPHLIDLGIRVRENVSRYKFEYASNFDASFTEFATIQATGYRSVSVPEVPIADSSHRGYTRFLFDPADYVDEGLDVNDATPLWIRVTPINLAGVEGDPEARHLILPYSSTPDRTVVLAGTAAGGANITESIELQLPGQCFDLYAQTDGATVLKIAFERPGSELDVLPVPSTFMSYKSNSGFSQMFIRGAGTDTTFSMTFALRQPSR